MQDKGRVLVSVLLYGVNLLYSWTATVSSSRLAVFLQIMICFYVLGSYNIKLCLPGTAVNIGSLAFLYTVENKNILSAIYSWPQACLNLQLKFHHPCAIIKALKCTWKCISLSFLPSLWQNSRALESYLLWVAFPLVMLFIEQMFKKLPSCLPRSCNQNKAPSCPLPLSWL